MLMKKPIQQNGSKDSELKQMHQRLETMKVNYKPPPIQKQQSHISQFSLSFPKKIFLMKKMFKDQCKKVMIAERQFKYKGNIVQINGGKWKNKKDVLDIVRVMKEWTIRKLLLSGNDRTNIIKDIAHICFVNLIFLQLDKNNIQSIEVLHTIDMVNIQKISLADNHIMSIRILKKGKWPQLGNLKIENNQLCQYNFLAQAYLPKLSDVKLYEKDEQNQKQKLELINPYFSFKLQTKSLSSFEIEANKLAFERSSSRVLLKKWINLTIK